MKYVLVLQWPASLIGDYDALIELENSLIERLPAESVVDGHDFGLDEMNVFIRTDDPRAAFKSVTDLLQKSGQLENARAAFRPHDGESYTVLWPRGLNTFNVS